VSYFRVFRSKCYVLQKRSKSSKFAPKVYEGFLLGYDSNSHAYHVFNKDSSCVEITCDVVFDETDFQVEQYGLDIVNDEEAPCEVLQRTGCTLWTPPQRQLFPRETIQEHGALTKGKIMAPRQCVGTSSLPINDKIAQLGLRIEQGK
jgi:hypothetical protein